MLTGGRQPSRCRAGWSSTTKEPKSLSTAWPWLAALAASLSQLGGTGSSHRVFDHRPGITGLAQVQGIDMSTPELLAQTDAQMLHGLTVAAYFKYLLLTLSGRGAGDRIARPPG